MVKINTEIQFIDNIEKLIEEINGIENCIVCKKEIENEMLYMELNSLNHSPHDLKNIEQKALAILLKSVKFKGE